MKIPVIGLLPLWDEEKNSLWMLPGYMDGIKHAGGLPVMLSLTSDKTQISQIARSVDGLLFTGGHDIFPGLYGEETSVHCGLICKERDDMEALLFTEAVLNMDLPAFGICRGLQLMNVVLGGTLYQDLPTQHKSKIAINHQQLPPVDAPSHWMEITKNSPLRTLFGSKSIEVNSTHHQGIKDLSPALECMATADDGLIEAVYMPDKKFVWAVQWHPELTLYDENSHLLFDAFVGVCGKSRRV